MYRSHTLAASDVNTGELWILMGGLGWAPKTSPSSTKFPKQL